MPAEPSPFDADKFIHPAQVGGIESYAFDEGAARGVRALCVNTGGGLRYRVLVDRGLDIDQAYFNQHSLTFLAHKGVTPPNAEALGRGLDWLKGFPVGLLTSCGPTNMGGPGTDAGEELGLHGPHSNTPATIESVVQPDPRGGRHEMSITGLLRYGAFYGPNIELRRTISSALGSNAIRVTDEFFNAANTPTPHQWLLHINLGYPLVDAGAELCVDSKRVEPLTGHGPSIAHFKTDGKFKRCPEPRDDHSGPNSFVGYLYPKADRAGRATVGMVNRKLGIGLAVDYNTAEFPRLASWQHWGKHEYVTALEPSTGTVEGRARDRELGILRTLQPGQRQRYAYTIRVVTDKGELEALRALNTK